MYFYLNESISMHFIARSVDNSGCQLNSLGRMLQNLQFLLSDGFLIRTDEFHVDRVTLGYRGWSSIAIGTGCSGGFRRLTGVGWECSCYGTTGRINVRTITNDLIFKLSYYVIISNLH